MSDMTDSEFLRDVAHCYMAPQSIRVDLSDRLKSIADYLDAMQADDQEALAYVAYLDGDCWVFPSRQDAEYKIDGELQEGDPDIEIIPLYPRQQWRDKPPDTEGDWVRKWDDEDFDERLLARHYGVGGEGQEREQHFPGELWFKLPKPKVTLTGTVAK